MPAHESLDALIARKAVQFAENLRQIAAMADKEEEIRIAVERELAFIEREAGIKLEARHEFTLASGRPDSLYSSVVIEYKNPSSPGDRIGPKADAPGVKKVVEQIKRRFRDLKDQHGWQLQKLYGIGFDGLYFVFVRWLDDKWDVQGPVELAPHTAEQFLWRVLNLGSAGKPFSPEYLTPDFGADSPLAQEGIRALYAAIKDSDNPKAQTFFGQWKILFGEVCGYDVETPSEKVKKLAQAYGVPERGLKSAELIFSLHTYYALFMKLLVYEVVSYLRRETSPLQRLVSAATPNKLQQELKDLELGGVFRHFHVTNFLEGDLFTWYLSAWSAPIEKLIRDLAKKLDEYSPGTMKADATASRDLLKKLYHQLFPKSVRHDLGEYYTPDWLAEHVLN